MRVLVAVVAYEAEALIAPLLDRVPAEVEGLALTVVVADDASSDRTVERSEAWCAAHPERDVRVVRRSDNLGYGGNQQACYRWAAEQGFEVVVLLHGDAQYPPEMIGDLVRPIVHDGEVAVFGSRMTEPRRARAGGMPLDRYVGNRVLSRVLNALTGARFAEWYSGFRAYRVDALVALGLDDLPCGFDFDTAITMRLIAEGHTIREVPIPTRYADEISRVPLVRTGLAGVGHGIRHRRRARASAG